MTHLLAHRTSRPRVSNPTKFTLKLAAQMGEHKTCPGGDSCTVLQLTVSPGCPGGPGSPWGPAAPCSGKQKHSLLPSLMNSKYAGWSLVWQSVYARTVRRTLPYYVHTYVHVCIICGQNALSNDYKGTPTVPALSFAHHTTAYPPHPHPLTPPTRTSHTHTS